MAQLEAEKADVGKYDIDEMFQVTPNSTLDLSLAYRPL